MELPYEGLEDVFPGFHHGEGLERGAPGGATPVILAVIKDNKDILVVFYNRQVIRRSRKNEQATADSRTEKIAGTDSQLLPRN